MIFTKCPVGCDSSLVKSDVVVPECVLLACPSCGQLLSSADEALYDETMRRFDNAAEIDTNQRVHLKRLSRLQHYWRTAPEKTRILDVGSSFGMFLKVLKDNKFNSAGVEPSKEAAEKCVREGLEAHCGFLEDVAFPDESFDVITLYEVIEHLKSPKPLLAECRRILKKDGMMFISTGNTDSWTAHYLKGKWDYYSMQDGGQGHISFFNPRSLSKLAESVGFRVHGLETRRVKFVNKKYDSGFKLALGKILQELCSSPAKMLGKGHDMLIVLKK